MGADLWGNYGRGARWQEHQVHSTRIVLEILVDGFGIQSVLVGDVAAGIPKMYPKINPLRSIKNEDDIAEQILP